MDQYDAIDARLQDEAQAIRNTKNTIAGIVDLAGTAAKSIQSHYHQKANDQYSEAVLDSDGHWKKVQSLYNTSSLWVYDDGTIAELDKNGIPQTRNGESPTQVIDADKAVEVQKQYDANLMQSYSESGNFIQDKQFKKLSKNFSKKLDQTYNEWIVTTSAKEGLSRADAEENKMLTSITSTSGMSEFSFVQQKYQSGTVTAKYSENGEFLGFKDEDGLVPMSDYEREQMAIAMKEVDPSTCTPEKYQDYCIAKTTALIKTNMYLAAANAGSSLNKAVSYANQFGEQMIPVILKNSILEQLSTDAANMTRSQFDIAFESSKTSYAEAYKTATGEDLTFAQQEAFDKDMNALKANIVSSKVSEAKSLIAPDSEYGKYMQECFDNGTVPSVSTMAEKLGIENDNGNIKIYDSVFTYSSDILQQVVDNIRTINAVTVYRNYDRALLTGDTQKIDAALKKVKEYPDLYNVFFKDDPATSGLDYTSFGYNHLVSTGDSKIDNMLKRNIWTLRSDADYAEQQTLNSTAINSLSSYTGAATTKAQFENQAGEQWESFSTEFDKNTESYVESNMDKWYSDNGYDKDNLTPEQEEAASSHESTLRTLRELEKQAEASNVITSATSTMATSKSTYESTYVGDDKVSRWNDAVSANEIENNQYSLFKSQNETLAQAEVNKNAKISLDKYEEYSDIYAQYKNGVGEVYTAFVDQFKSETETLADKLWTDEGWTKDSEGEWTKEGATENDKDLMVWNEYWLRSNREELMKQTAISYKNTAKAIADASKKAFEDYYEGEDKESLKATATANATNFDEIYTSQADYNKSVEEEIGEAEKEEAYDNAYALALNMIAAIATGEDAEYLQAFITGNEESSLDLLKNAYNALKSAVDKSGKKMSDLVAEIKEDPKYQDYVEVLTSRAYWANISGQLTSLGFVNSTPIDGYQNIFSGRAVKELCEEFGIQMLSDIPTDSYLSTIRQRYYSLSPEEQQKYEDADDYLTTLMQEKIMGYCEQTDKMYKWLCEVNLYNKSEYNSATEADITKVKTELQEAAGFSATEGMPTALQYAINWLGQNRPITQIQAELAHLYNNGEGSITKSDYDMAMRFIQSGEDVISMVINSYGGNQQSISAQIQSLRDYIGNIPNKDNILVGLVMSAINGIIDWENGAMDENGHFMIKTGQNGNQDTKVREALQGLINGIAVHTIKSKTDLAFGITQNYKEGNAMTVKSYLDIYSTFDYNCADSSFDANVKYIADSDSQASMILGLVANGKGSDGKKLNDADKGKYITYVALLGMSKASGVDLSMDTTTFNNAVKDIISGMSDYELQMFGGLGGFAAQYSKFIEGMNSGSYGSTMGDYFENGEKTFEYSKGVVKLSFIKDDGTKLTIAMDNGNGQIDGGNPNMTVTGPNGETSNVKGMNGSAIQAVVSGFDFAMSDYITTYGLGGDLMKAQYYDKSANKDIIRSDGVDYVPEASTVNFMRNKAYESFTRTDDDIAMNGDDMILFGGANLSSLTNEQKTALTNAVNINMKYKKLGLEEPIKLYAVTAKNGSVNDPDMKLIAFDGTPENDDVEFREVPLSWLIEQIDIASEQYDLLPKGIPLYDIPEGTNESPLFW